MEDRCVCCNCIIPEGRHVCIQCETDIMQDSSYKKHIKDLTQKGKKKNTSKNP